MERYEFLNRTKYILHDEHRDQVSEATLKEMSAYIPFELFSRETIVNMSSNDSIQNKLDSLIREFLELQRKYPEGSNQECMAMDSITELLSKLDLEDFRKLNIQGLISSGKK
jgi:hypothetical protein